jgi:putative ABC transport system permease protein
VIRRKRHTHGEHAGRDEQAPATAAVFSLIEGVLLTRPPYANPDQLVLIQPVRTDNRTVVRRWPAQLWLKWQREAKSFESIAGYGWSFNFLVSDDGCRCSARRRSFS